MIGDDKLFQIFAPFFMIADKLFRFCRGTTCKKKEITKILVQNLWQL